MHQLCDHIPVCLWKLDVTWGFIPWRPGYNSMAHSPLWFLWALLSLGFSGLLCLPTRCSLRSILWNLAPSLAVTHTQTTAINYSFAHSIPEKSQIYCRKHPGKEGQRKRALSHKDTNYFKMTCWASCGLSWPDTSLSFSYWLLSSLFPFFTFPYFPPLPPDWTKNLEVFSSVKHRNSAFSRFYPQTPMTNLFLVLISLNYSIG